MSLKNAAEGSVELPKSLKYHKCQTNTLIQGCPSHLKNCRMLKSSGTKHLRKYSQHIVRNLCVVAITKYHKTESDHLPGKSSSMSSAVIQIDHESHVKGSFDT